MENINIDLITVETLTTGNIVDYSGTFAGLFEKYTAPSELLAAAHTVILKYPGKDSLEMSATDFVIMFAAEN